MAITIEKNTNAFDNSFIKNFIGKLSNLTLGY